MKKNIDVVQLQVGPMDNFSYLVSGMEGQCVVIDAGWDPDEILKEASKRKWKISAVLLTHGHFDHAQAVAILEREIRCKVYINVEDSEEFSSLAHLVKTTDEQLVDEAGLKFKCLHTPGHTPGSQCFLLDGLLFTGDVLFVGCSGRVDLPGSDPDAMERSFERLSKLPKETVIYPGHHYGETPTSTIGEELLNNPSLWSYR